MAMLQEAKTKEVPPEDAAPSPDGSQTPDAPAGGDTPTGASPDAAATDDSTPDSSSSGDSSGENLSPEEEAELNQAVQALYKVMYQSEGTSKAVADQFQPEAKVDSVSKASILIIKQLDERLNLSEDIVPVFTAIVVEQTTEMAEKVKGMKFSEQELQAVLGATYESVLHMLGMDPATAQQKLSSYSPEEQQKAQQDYQKFLGSAKGDDMGQPTAPQPDASAQAAPPANAQTPPTEELPNG